MQVIFNGHRAKIVSPVDSITLEKLSQAMKFQPLHMKFMPYKQKKIATRFWDGFVKLFNKTTKEFPTGLISKLLEIDPKAIVKPEKPLKTFSMTQKLSCLYEYQIRAVEALINSPYSHSMAELATASGKSVLTAELCLRAENMKVLVTVPTLDLLHQTKDALVHWTGEEVGIYGDKSKEIDKRITVATIQSLASGVKYDNKSKRAVYPDKLKERAEWLRTIDYLIVDECHGAAAESYQILSSLLSNTYIRHGLTATLRREDGNELILHGVLGPCVTKVTPAELISKGFLALPRVELHYLSHGNYNSSLGFAELYKEAVVNNSNRTSYIAEQAKRCLAEARGPVLILFDLLEHGDNLYAAVKDLGRSALVSGSTETKDRKSLVQQVENGEIDIVVASIIWVTGVNIRRLKTLIVAGSGKSGTMTVQRAGRVLRTHPDKEEALIIDICDEERLYLRDQYIARRFFYNEKYPGYVYDIRED